MFSHVFSFVPMRAGLIHTPRVFRHIIAPIVLQCFHCFLLFYTYTNAYPHPLKRLTGHLREPNHSSFFHGPQLGPQSSDCPRRISSQQSQFKNSAKDPSISIDAKITEITRILGALIIHFNILVSPWSRIVLCEFFDGR